MTTWAVVRSDIVLSGPEDLGKQYDVIFKTGNRNAASHLWASFILERATSMTAATIENVFKGFCPVSGSPLPNSPDTMYKVSLPSVTGDLVTGVTRHCCWPCICDLSDFVRVDTLTVPTIDGPKVYKMLVLGDPCKHPEKLNQDFTDPFSGEQAPLLEAAPELACDNTGGKDTLRGATYSDHGYPVIGMFFTDPVEVSSVTAPPLPVLDKDPTFGYGGMCVKRKNEGFNSGMGLIFQLVASISTIPNSPSLPLPQASASSSQQKDAIPPQLLQLPHSTGWPKQLSMLLVCAAFVGIALPLMRLHVSEFCGVCRRRASGVSPPFQIELE